MSARPEREVLIEKHRSRVIANGDGKHSRRARVGDGDSGRETVSIVERQKDSFRSAHTHRADGF